MIRFIKCFLAVLAGYKHIGRGIVDIGCGTEWHG